jgi:phosphatidylserine decarboxylase
MQWNKMSKPLELTIWDRDARRHVTEFMDDSPSTYESEPGGSFSQRLQSHPMYDWLIAAYQNTRFSAKKIEPFVQKYSIDMSEFEPGPYQTYADFFDRRFLPNKRQFTQKANEMAAFAEARYLGWCSWNAETLFSVKGHSVTAADILGDDELAKPYEGGPTLLARLSPMDYHHLHYPDDGESLEEKRIGRRLWTVNPNALRNKPEILLKNERVIQILNTRHMGRLAFVEIGALSVGRIVRVHPTDKPFKRGDEKSVFRFGGSAVVVFGEKNAWQPSADILEQTRAGVETYIRLGQPVASRKITVVADSRT